MITTPPQNKYDEQMLDILQHDKIYRRWSDGEKSIFYDLAHYIHKYTKFDWEDISLDYFLYNISLIYDKHKNKQLIAVIAECIDHIFPNFIADIIEDGERRKLVVTDIGGKNG